MLVFVAAAVGVSAAQTQQQPPTNDTTSDSQPHSAPAPALSGGYLMPEGQEEGVAATWTSLHPIVPAMVGGYTSSMAFGDEIERSNHVRGGLTVQSTYDDNPYATNGSSGSSDSNYSVSIFPQISLDQSRSRLRWLVNYAGGFTFNQKLTTQNNTSQSFNFDFQYRLSPHVNMRVSEGIGLTTGLFGPVNSSTGSAPAIPDGGNGFVLTPLAKQFATVTRGEIDYQFSGADLVGASGGFTSLQYRDLAPGQTLIDNRTESGSGFYAHRVTPTNWLGVSYEFQHLGYPGTLDDTQVHSVIGFDTYALKPSITLSLFGGPQYSDDQFPTASTPPQTASQTMWSVAGGASLSWTSQRTSAQATYSHSVADGGGLQGSVQLNSVSGTFRRKITRHTAVTFTGSYATNDDLAPSSTGVASAKYASGGVNVTRQFGTHWFVQAAYARQSQQTTGSNTFGNDAQRDQVMASFSYQFVRPWGQ